MLMEPLVSLKKEVDLNASLTGTTASYVDVENAEVAAGRFFLT